MLKLSLGIRPEQNLERFLEQARTASEAGYQALTLEIDGEPPTASMGESQYRDLSAAARSAGVRIVASYLRTSIDVQLGAGRPALQRQAIDQCLYALDRTSWLACDTLIMAPGLTGRAAADGPALGYEEVYMRSLDALSDLRFAAQARAVRLACALPSGRFLVSPLEARNFLDSVNSPWVGACLDLPRAAMVGDAEDWLNTLGARVMQVQTDGTSALPRDGLPPATRDALRKIGYTGYLTISDGSGS